MEPAMIGNEPEEIEMRFLQNLLNERDLRRDFAVVRAYAVNEQTRVSLIFTSLGSAALQD